MKVSLPFWRKPWKSTGFVWLPNDILESPYDGEIEHYRPDYRGEKWRPKDLNFDPYAPPKDYPGNWRKPLLQRLRRPG